MSSNLIVLEFNEVNREILLDMVGRSLLPNFKRLIEQGTLLRTSVPESYANLEPWIQWVTAHTGKLQHEHGAFNLSDVQHTQLQQIWDVLEAEGVPCGLVSPMNARRGALKQGFFIPDPWTVSDETHPAPLKPIYSFLAEKVQQHNVALDAGSSKLGFLLTCLRAGVPLSAVLRLGTAYVEQRLDSRAKWKLAASLDRFLWDITCSLRSQFKTRYTSVFMNSVAHYQHHYWDRHTGTGWKDRFPALFAQRNPVAEEKLKPGDDPIAFGLHVYDTIVGEAVRAAGIDQVAVVTGLSQVPFEGYEGGTGFYLYRPIDHDRLWAALGVRPQRCAPLMSRDAMLYFSSDAERDQAQHLLAQAKVNGRPLLQQTAETDSRLFVKVIYSFDAAPDAEVVHGLDGSGRLRFHDHLLLITFKTGHHSPEGLVIAPSRGFAPGFVPQDPIPLTAVPALLLRLMKVPEADIKARALATAMA